MSTIINLGLTYDDFVNPVIDILTIDEDSNRYMTDSRGQRMNVFL
jgi:hypothetical protein